MKSGPAKKREHASPAAWHGMPAQRRTHQPAQSSLSTAHTRHHRAAPPAQGPGRWASSITQYPDQKEHGTAHGAACHSMNAAVGPGASFRKLVGGSVLTINRPTKRRHTQAALANAPLSTARLSRTARYKSSPLSGPGQPPGAGVSASSRAAASSAHRPHYGGRQARACPRSHVPRRASPGAAGARRSAGAERRSPGQVSRPGQPWAWAPPPPHAQRRPRAWRRRRRGRPARARPGAPARLRTRAGR